eukprot:3039422-Amphidinium_carterae.1
MEHSLCPNFSIYDNDCHDHAMHAHISDDFPTLTFRPFCKQTFKLVIKVSQASFREQKTLA